MSSFSLSLSLSPLSNQDRESSRETVRERPIHRSHLLVRHLFWKRSPFPANLRANSIRVYHHCSRILTASFFFPFFLLLFSAPLPLHLPSPLRRAFQMASSAVRDRSIIFFLFHPTEYQGEMLTMFREIEIERQRWSKKSSERASQCRRRGDPWEMESSGFSRIPARFQSAERAARA